MGRKHSKTDRMILLLTVALSESILELKADENNHPTNTLTNASPVVMVDVRTKVPGSFVPYRYAFVTSGTTKYTFLIPDGYRLDSSNPAEVKLINPDMDCFLTIGFNQGECPHTTEALTDHVGKKFTGASVQSNQTIALDGRTAIAIDFRWRGGAGMPRVSRKAFVSTENGAIKIALTASPEKFESGVQNYNLVLQTFRISNTGKFDYVIGSDKP